MKIADISWMKVVAQILFAAAMFAAQPNLSAAERYFSERDLVTLAKAVSELDAATLASDVTALEKLVSPEYNFVDATGKVWGKAEEIANYRSGDLKVEAISRSGSKTRLYVGGGLMTGVLTIKGKYKNQDISGDYRFVEMFEPGKGGWQIYFSQITKIAVEK